MVIEGLQLLLPVVQLYEDSVVLVQGPIHRWRAKLDDGVVFLVGVLRESTRE